MKTEAEDIEMLERAIMVEAREEADQLRAEAKEKADAIRQRAQAEAEAERKAILDRAKQDADRFRSQASASAQLQSRSTQLEQREKLLDNVFAEVKKQLDGVKKRSDYGAIVAMLAHEALTQLKATKAEVQADEATQKVLKLDEISKERSEERRVGKEGRGRRWEA